MKLIIAEKPDMMRKFAQALLKGPIKKTAKTVGKIKMNVILENDDIAITCSHGHLYRYKRPEEISEKYKKWQMENLPLNFEDIPLVASTNAFDKLLISVNKELLERPEITEVICACDIDREGESIPREIINMLEASSAKIRKLNKTRTFSRMWFVEQGDGPLKEAYKNRKPLSVYNNIYYSAKARQFADYKVGLSATQAMTLKCGGKGAVMTVGRVQTPTLRIVVDLEKEIRNFVPVDFFKINAITKEGIIGEYQIPDSKDNRFSKSDDAKKVIEKTGTGKALITKVQTKEAKQNPKKLYSMSSLQADMNRRFNLTAHQTLEITQKLYEAAMVTYPRTEEECVSKDFASRIQNAMFNGSLEFPNFKKAFDTIISNNFKLNSQVIAKESTEIGAHEAITPATTNVTLEKVKALSDTERKVYLAIVERFLENFFPPAVYDVQTVEFERNGSIFAAQFKALNKEGYLFVNNASEGDKTKELKKVNKGDSLAIDKLELVSSKTQPPARFTEASLIDMMKNPVKYVDDKDEKSIIKETHGIGTGATRDTIIEGLKHQDLIRLEKKSIVPTEKGIQLIDSIPSELIKSVSLTAHFEQKLKEIYDGKFTFEKFQEEVHELMNKFVEEVNKMDAKVYNHEASKDNVLCKCPHCGKNIVVNKFGYFCEDKKCGVKIFTTQLEKSLHCPMITKTQAKELLTKGKTKKKVHLLSKAGKEYEAYLTYEFKEDEKFPNNVWIAFD